MKHSTRWSRLPSLVVALVACASDGRSPEPAGNPELGIVEFKTEESPTKTAVRPSG
jgi:hypothetical protein